MELNETVEAARVMKRGYQSGIACGEGKSITIETSPGGDEILDAECPEGKTWTISVNICIEEMDA